MKDLEVGLVPREEFASRQWFSARASKATPAGVPVWYYHRPGRPLPMRIQSDFYSRIDPHLRDLCLSFHQAGIATLPSCEGHFHPREYFLAVWDELQWHCDAIRDSGLKLVDSESEERVVFANPTYELPWPSFPAFYEDLGTTQPGGYLGIALRPQDRKLAKELSSHSLGEPRAHLSLQQPWDSSWIAVAAVYVDPTCPEDVGRQWSAVHSYFRRLLRKPRIDTTISVP